MKHFVRQHSSAARQMKPMGFTLIELLVSTVISSWHFFAQKSAVATQQRIPLFLKREVGFGERGKTSFPARAAGCGKTRPSVFVSLRRDESLRWGSDNDISQRVPLFFERERGRGGKGKLFFSWKKVFLVPRTLPFHFNRIAGCYCDDGNFGSDSSACAAKSKGTGNDVKLYLPHQAVRNDKYVLLQWLWGVYAKILGRILSVDGIKKLSPGKYLQVEGNCSRERRSAESTGILLSEIFPSSKDCHLQRDGILRMDQFWILETPPYEHQESKKTL